jgi:hypothetical protein
VVACGRSCAASEAVEAALARELQARALPPLRRPPGGGDLPFAWVEDYGDSEKLWRVQMLLG